MSFLEMHAPGGVIDTLVKPHNTIISNRSGTERVVFTADGTEISFDITAEEFITVAFSMKKV